MATRPSIANWAGQISDGALVEGPTPPARYEYLIALAERVSAACLTPYAMTGLSALYASDATGGRRYAAQRVNVATSSLQGVYTRSSGGSGSGGADTSAFGLTSSGTTSADEILTPASEADGTTYPPEVPTVIEQADAVVTAPSVAQDRLFETTTTLDGPYTEVFLIGGATGFVVRPNLVTDLGAI